MARSAPQTLSAPDIASRLAPLVDRFDRLCHEASLTPLSHRDYDRLEEQATAIAVALRAVFRGERR